MRSKRSRTRGLAPALLAGAASLGLLATGGAAHAQSTDPSVVEGAGYPVSEGAVIHPVLGAEVGMISNVFYEESDSKPYTTGIFRLVAEASLASKDPEPAPELDPLLDPTEEAAAEPAAQKIQFRAGGRIDYTEYLAPAAYVRAQRTLGANLKGRLVVAPEGKFKFTADEHFRRDTRPTNFESVDSNNRIANNLGLAVTYQPGGRQIGVSLGWDNQIDYFEDSDSRFANRMINSLRARADWQWLPYTRFYADFNWGFIGGFASDTLNGMQYKRSAMPIRGGVGVATSITELITVKAHAGWGYASYSGGTGYNLPVLGVEAGYRYMPTGRFTVGYDWDHRDSINADYYTDHAIVGRVDHQFGTRIIGHATGDIRFRSYRGISPQIGAPSRDDVLFAIGAGATYVLKDWMGIVANWRSEVDQTSYMTNVAADDPSYSRHEITVGVRAAL